MPKKKGEKIIMNIKKSIMKTMCAALACATIMSNALAAYAIDAIVTETPMDSGGGDGLQMRAVWKRLK